MLAVRPQIHIIAHKSQEALALEALAGLEEEGVPGVLLWSEGQEAANLALEAAEESTLGCGLGFALGKAVLAVSEGNKPQILLAPGAVGPEEARGMGANAARYVKRQRLR